MRRLFLWTFIFLCTAFSASAQSCDSLRLRAVECERVHFLSQDAAEAEHALMEKAEILLQAGDTTGATSTLARINMYQLSEDDRETCTKTLSSLIKDDSSTEQKGLVHKYKAFLPPLGHIEAGETGRGMLMTLLDAGSLAFGIWQCVSGQWLTGYLVGAVGLDIFYYDEAVRLISQSGQQ